MKTKNETIAELRQLVKELWYVRKYGIREMDLWMRVCRAVPDDITGLRPCDEKGISLIPKTENGKISYTHHFENETR